MDSNIGHFQALYKEQLAHLQLQKAAEMVELNEPASCRYDTMQTKIEGMEAMGVQWSPAAGDAAGAAAAAAEEEEDTTPTWRQDTSPQSRARLLELLPPPVVRQIAGQAGVPASGLVEEMPVAELAARPELVAVEPQRLQQAVRQTIGGIVAQSAWRQSAKGVLTAGVGKVLTYLYQKWQTGRATRRTRRAAAAARTHRR